MPAPLKQHHDDEQENLQPDASPKYKEFQEFNSNSAKLRELVFFARIALFSVTTVLIAFLLLVLNLSAIWAFVLALLSSLAINSAVTAFIWSLLKQ